MFHFMFVHYTFSSVWVTEWPPFGKIAARSVSNLFSLYFSIYTDLPSIGGPSKWSYVLSNTADARVVFPFWKNILWQQDHACIPVPPLSKQF